MISRYPRRLTAQVIRWMADLHGRVAVVRFKTYGPEDSTGVRHWNRMAYLEEAVIPRFGGSPYEPIWRCHGQQETP